MASPQTVKYAIKQVLGELILDCVQAQRGQLSLEKTLTPHSSSLNLASVCTLGMWHCYFFPFLIKCNYLETKKKVLRKHVTSLSKNLLLRKLFFSVQIRSGGEVWGKHSVPSNLGTDTHVTELGCLVLACNYAYKKQTSNLCIILKLSPEGYK